MLCREECAALRLELTARHKEESQATRAELVSRKEKELQEERARWQTEVERLKELVSTAACVCVLCHGGTLHVSFRALRTAVSDAGTELN